MVHLQPCRKTDTARETVQHFIHNVDRLGTELRFTTAHAPNSNGKVERVNTVLGDLLRALCSHSGRDWAQHLDLAEFAINGSTTSATGLTPFFANYARELRTPADLGQPRFDVPAADEFADAMFATITHTRALSVSTISSWLSGGERLTFFEPGRGFFCPPRIST